MAKLANGGELDHKNDNASGCRACTTDRNTSNTFSDDITGLHGSGKTGASCDSRQVGRKNDDGQAIGKSAQQLCTSSDNSADCKTFLLFIEPTLEPTKGQSAASEYDRDLSSLCTCTNKPVVSEEGGYICDNGAAPGLAYVVKVGAAVASQLGETGMAPLHYPGGVHGICLGPYSTDERVLVRRILEKIGARGRYIHIEVPAVNGII
jgi:hypothetical protein